MSGIVPTVPMLDVDRDGHPEAIVSFSSARRQGADWVLKWNGTTLQSIGPASVDANGNVATLLSEAEFCRFSRKRDAGNRFRPPQTGP